MAVTVDWPTYKVFGQPLPQKNISIFLGIFQYIPNMANLFELYYRMMINTEVSSIMFCYQH